MLFFSLFFCILPLSARHYSVLGGFKIGQKITDVKAGFPKIKKVHEYPDGVQVFIFMNGDVQVLLETHPKLPGLVWSIQISGLANAEHYGLDDTNLGLPVSEMTAKFGKPVTSKEGFHEILKKPFVAYHYYNAENNFSFESVEDKINSIKIMLTTEPKADLPNWAAFLTALKEKNYYRIAEMTDPDCILAINGKKAPIQGSMIDVLRKNSTYSKLLFDAKTGLASLKDSDIKGGVMRMFDDGRSGMVAFAHGGVKKEIVFLRGLTGFGLWELNTLRAGQE